MTDHDPAVIRRFASRLYSRARFITGFYTLLGILVPLLLFTRQSQLGPLELLLTFVVGGGLGAAIGTERAFSLRLQAQMALCQLQTEMNTRPQSPARVAA